MSGPICPDCAGFSVQAVEARERTDHCTFCGWSGPTRPRKKLTSTSFDAHVERNASKRGRREEGALFFLRIHGLVPSKAELLEWLRQAGLLRPASLGSGPSSRHNERGGYVYVELDAEPTPAQLAELESWSGATRVICR